MMKLNWKIYLLISGICFALFFSNCNQDDIVGDGDPVALSTVSTILVADIGEAGNGTDLQVSFNKIADESNVWAYRLYVVKSEESADFDLEKSKSISEMHSTKVDKTGNNISTALSTSARSTDGEIITNGVPYKVFVLTVTNDGSLFTSALSDASSAITLQDEGTNVTQVAAVSNVQAKDVGNAGNGSDLEISFTKAENENIVQSYRIYVVPAMQSLDFDLTMAEGVADENYSTSEITGSNFEDVLSIAAKTISGELISNDVAYQVFIMTVAKDAAQHGNALSAASPEITLSADEKVKVTYIANDGVMIEFAGKKVVIDAVNRTSNLGGWVTPSSNALMAVENGEPPYDNIDVIMITHAHADHYATVAVSNYLSNHPNTKLIVPSSMKQTFSAFNSQMPNFDLPKYERISLVENEINIDVLHIEHFDQFGYDFSGLESYAYLINFDGKTFFHGGDIDYVDSQLDVFNLLDDTITAAFIPTFGNLVSTTNRDAIIDNLNPDNIICLHFLSNTLAATINQINTIYPTAIIFETPFETVAF